MAAKKTTNGQADRAPLTDKQLDTWKEVVVNALMIRQEALQSFLDPRRSIADECGFPDDAATYNSEEYQKLFDRDPIANRVMSLMPDESWQVQPNLYEDEDPETQTAFEEAWDELGKNLKPEKSYYSADSGSPGGNPIWEYLHRADVLSGIGRFGVILLGINDGKLLQERVDGMPPDGYAGKDVTGVSGLGVSPSTGDAPAATSTGDPGNSPSPSDVTKDIYGGATQSAVPDQPYSSTMGTDAQYMGTQFTPGSFHGGDPANPMNPAEQAPGNASRPTKKLNFIRVFPEYLVQVVQYEADVRNPRFGMPVMYLITLNDHRQPHTGVGLPLATVRVHWHRVVHLCDNRTTSEIFGVPRARPCINNILSLQKVYGASGEGYWKSGLPTVSFETNPQLGGDVEVNQGALRDMVENVQNGLQKIFALTGMSAKTLPPSLVDPTPHITIQIQAICIYLECPMRVFMGSERGELASSQDDAAWNDRLRHRQQSHITPRVIGPFVDRLINIGILPEPEDGYIIEWPGLDAQTDSEKATILLTRTQAYAAYIAGNIEGTIAPITYMTEFDDMAKDKAEEALKESAKAVEEKLQDTSDLADQHGFEVAPPPGMKSPAPEPPPMPPPTPIKVKPGEKLVHPASVKPPAGSAPNPKTPSGVAP
jgi:hypothetical protein